MVQASVLKVIAEIWEQGHLATKGQEINIQTISQADYLNQCVWR